MATSKAPEVSIPVKLLYEAISQVITVELRCGDKYHGELTHVEPTMSLQMSQVTHTSKEGQTKRLEMIYLRGSQIKFFVLPDILQESPILEAATAAKRKFDTVQNERMKSQQKKVRANRNIAKRGRT